MRNRANGNAESSDSKHSKIAAYTESETFRSMPQSVIDRLMSHNKTRFSNMKMSEENIDSIVLKAARETLDLDLSGSQLTGEAPYFLLDSLSRNEFVNFVHVNLSSSEISPSGFSVLIDYFIYFNALETLNVRNNSLPKESGVAIAKILGGSSPLKLLDASGNSLGDAGEQCLCILMLGCLCGVIRNCSNSWSFHCGPFSARNARCWNVCYGAPNTNFSSNSNRSGSFKKQLRGWGAAGAMSRVDTFYESNAVFAKRRAQR